MKFILQIPASLDIGGVEKVARDIGMYADLNEYKIDYIVFDKKIGEYEAELITRGCNIYHLQEPSLSYHRFLKDLRYIMTQTKYDVVHAHTMFNIGWIMMIAREMQIPIRVAHAHSALNNNGGLKTKIYELIMRWLILNNSTDFIACGEKAGIRLFGEKMYRNKAKLILNGIEVKKFQYCSETRKTIRKQLNVENSYLIGHVGHLLEVKNQKFLIDLMPGILERRPEAILLLLGEGPDRQMLEAEIKKLKLEKHILLLGNVPDVYNYLSAMDVFAFPSLFEGMPLSILEVQANGLPCILSTEVPEDVYLTDLIHPLTLNDSQAWIEEICCAQRKKSEDYYMILEKERFDTQSVMNKIYAIYER